MSYVKRRIAAWLSMIMVFTAVFCIAPVQEVQAASLQFQWTIGAAGTETFYIEKGVKNLYIGDYVYAYTEGELKNFGLMSLNSGVKYSTTNKKVAAVNSKTGKITAKKKGTATIKVKFKGKTTKIKLKVVSSLKDRKSKIKNYSKRNKAAEKFLKKAGTGKITSKNRYAVLSAYAEYMASGNTMYSTYYFSDDKIYCILSPAAGRADMIEEKLNAYIQKLSPLSSASAKCFKVKSISGKGTKITIKLKKAVTADQLFGIKGTLLYTNNYEVSKAKAYEYPIAIYDYLDRPMLGVIKIKQGSKELKITLDNESMEPGTEYWIRDYNGDWLDPQLNYFVAK